MTGLFAYPQAAAFGRVVPKQRLYEHPGINPKVRELFVSEVRRITWAYKLAPETIGLSGSPSVPEIQVFAVDLKDVDLHDEVLGAIDRAVQFPIIFEIKRTTMDQCTSAIPSPLRSLATTACAAVPFASTSQRAPGPWLASSYTRR